MSTDKDFMTLIKPTWCVGCGDFGIWTALRQALAELGREPHQVAMVFDIGCCGNGANWHRVYGFHSLHGRVLPVAAAAKLANHELTVIGVSGDGGGYGEGGNHFIHTCRGNHDLTYIIHNNQMYSLTTGQSSPMTDQNTKTKSTPDGQIEVHFSPLQTAIANGATFVARGFADDVPHLKDLIKKAISHKGFSLIDILQPCVTLNKINTREWYRQRIYKLESTGWKADNKDTALVKAGEWGAKIPIGIFYQVQQRAYHEFLPQLKEKPLVKIEVAKKEIVDLLKEFQ